MIAKRIDAIKQKPEDSPFTPSIRFIALIIPTQENMVRGMDMYSGMQPRPQSPWKQLSEAPFTYINQQMMSISIAKRIVGVKFSISSIMPTYSIINMAAVSMNALGLSNIACELHKPMIIPKKTAAPPMLGTGLLCNFLAEGLSTKSFITAIFNTLGCIQSVPRKANNAGIMI